MCTLQEKSQESLRLHILQLAAFPKALGLVPMGTTEKVVPYA